jgi:hypothetical protein
VVVAGEQAEAMALRVLAFLAGDEERFHRFLLSTGTTPDDVRRRAGEPDFLSGVIDHLLTDDALLIAFAEDAALEPAAVVAARRRLPGAVLDQ